MLLQGDNSAIPLCANSLWERMHLKQCDQAYYLPYKTQMPLRVKIINKYH